MALTPGESRQQRDVALTGLLAGFMGCLLMFVLAKLGKVTEYDPGRWPKVLIFLAVLVTVGFLIGAAARRSGGSHAARAAAIGFGASLVGIAGSSVFWKLVEDYVFSQVGTSPIYEERVLFPIEIAILWFFGSIPILVGLVTGLTLTSARE